MAVNSRLIIPDGKNIAFKQINNSGVEGLIAMEGPAIKISGGGNHVLVSSGHNLLFQGANHTIGGNSSIINLGKTGDTVVLNTTGTTYQLPSIGTLKDVSITSPINGHTLRYNGTSWENTVATNLNTVNTLVARDASGNFSAGTISANLIGTSTATVAAGSTLELIRGTMASNDYFRIMIGGAADLGYVELATADGGAEPIYVRQYTGVFSALTRSATLLDEAGNTSFPGTIAWSGGGSANANLAFTHKSSTGTDHSYINQDVTTTSSPRFSKLTIGNSATSNYLTFNGVNGDAGEMTFIGERLYGVSDQSELVMFKGNDSTDDRIRLISGNILFDTYSVATSGSFESVSTSVNVSTKMILSTAGNLGIGILLPTERLHVVGNIKVDGNIKVSNAGGADAIVELDRGAGANWRLRDSSGILHFESDYTTVKSTYSDHMTLDYNTGNLWIKGNAVILGAVTASTFSGNATSASKLATTRAISLSGDVTGTVNFDGTGAVVIPAVYKNSGVAAGTYRSVTVDLKGNVTNGSNPTTLDAAGITGGTLTTDLIVNAAVQVKNFKMEYNETTKSVDFSFV